MSDTNGAEAPSETLSTEERAHLQQEAPETPETETEAQPAEKTKPETEEERKVNNGALAEERGRRREAEQRLRNAEIIQARMEERFRAWQMANQPKPEPLPDPDADPFAAVKHLWNENQRTRGEIEAYKRQEAFKQHTAQQQQRAIQQVDQVSTWTKSLEDQFRAKTPDYDDACNHFLGARVAELRAYGMPENQIKPTVEREALQLAFHAAQSGKNPAELVYELSKQRGYQKKQPAADLNNQLDVIEAGQQASKSLSNVGGKAGGGEITLRDLANMSEDEFAAYKAKNPAKYRRLMGATQ